MNELGPVAVIVLNWNRLDDTAACCRSLEPQMHGVGAVWVVDNGSTLHSVEDLQRACPKATILRLERNTGFAAGNNRAIEAVLRHQRPRAFWLLNNDTVADPGTLSHMLHGMDADARVGAVGSVICDMNPPHAVQSWGGRWVSPWIGIPLPCRGPRARLNYLCGASVLIRTSALEQTGLLDEGFFFYFEDADYSFRLRNAGWRLTVAPHARVLHKGGGTIGSQDELRARLYRQSLIRFLRKHSRLPVFPALLATTIRLGIAGAKGQHAIVKGTLSGWREGWRTRL